MILSEMPYNFARVHTRSWQSAYRGILSDDYLDALRWEVRFEMWSGRLSNTQPTSNDLFVAINAEGAVTGFATIGEVRDDDLVSRKFFELYAIYVDPESWSRGVGRSLIDAALMSVPSCIPGVSLWVLADNDRGRRFYERQGFEHDGMIRIERIGDRDLEEVRYIRTGG
jgi:ribosomal protein S18 acetylase RimI-like enzyme